MIGVWRGRAAGYAGLTFGVGRARLEARERVVEKTSPRDEKNEKEPRSQNS